MRRGRPRHQDILTPREWQVLDLLRDGLTNDQIAARLGISLDTAKFHVSEILSKLGVETRQQAAAWQGRPRAIPAAGLPAAIARYAGSLSPLKLAGAGVIAAAAVGLAALAAGVLLTDPKSRPEQTVAPDGRTGDEAGDSIIDSLLHDDAAALARRFAGVTAREGAVMGGPAGIDKPRTVRSEEWTAYLTGTPRTLHAVVREPSEPYPVGPRNTPNVVLTPPRDYDILLLEDGPDRHTYPWRFSVEDGSVIDVVIDSGWWFHGRYGGLAILMPSPVENPSDFAVIPPEALWPAPTPLPETGVTRPSGIASPAYAPDGRTGDLVIDGFIESLLRDGAVTLATRHPDLIARLEACDPGDPQTCRSFVTRASPAEWTARFTAGRRSLYTVITGDPADVEILIAVDTGGYAAEAWRFSLIAGKLVQVDISVPQPQPPPAGADLSDYFWTRFGYYKPSPSDEYERFFVFPPREDLPGLSPARRSGIPLVDALLDAAYARDEARVATLVFYQAVACAPRGSGIGRLYCPDGTAPGTAIEAIPTAACEGGYLTRQSTAHALIDAIVPNALYAVAATSAPTTALSGRIQAQEPPGMIVILANQRGTVAIVMNRLGVVAIDRGCGKEDPPKLVDTDPLYLLPAP